MTYDEIMEIFKLGIDYGQLLMEQERDSEDWADAFQGYIIDLKYSMPANIAPRRQPHSNEWRKAKLDSLDKVMSLLADAKTKELIKKKLIK